MRKFLLAITFLVAGAIIFGCAAPRYTVQVNGYTEPEAPPLAPGSSCFVIVNKDAKNPLLEKEVKEKIDKLLEKQGYRLASYEKAEYYLFFSYGIGGEGSTTVVMPENAPFIGYGLGPGPLYGRRSYFFVAPFFSYYPYPETVALYNRWLLINVVDAIYYREKGQFRTVWVGEARSIGSSSDLRTVINYLLLAGFKEFGKNTGKAVPVEIGEQEPLVSGLTVTN
jgi:hypothetical protein